MATTTRSRADRARRTGPGVLACASALAAAAAHAQVQAPPVEFGISTQATWTSNSSFGEGLITAGPTSSDTILEVRPRVVFRSNGARLRVSGSASVAGLAYARNTQPGALEPTADVSARLAAIERLFFVEAGYRAAQTSENPFGARADASSSTNRLTTSQWRLSPIVEGSTGQLRYSLRNDNTWTKAIGADSPAVAGGSGYFGRVQASVERAPQPLGWALEAERSRTEYDDPQEQDLSVALARVRLTYAVDADWVFGVRGGYERNNADRTLDEWRSIAGVEVRWQPSPRTTFSLVREKRFFGSGWDVAFTHRQPRVAWNLALNRGVDTTPQQLLQLPSSDNVAGLIDAMFTTRFPDPAERARVVQDYMARQGLPASTQGPITLYSSRFSLVTGRRASLSFIGVRNTLTLSGYSTRTEDAVDDNGPALGLVSQNNTQRGASVVWSHRLTPLASLSASADWSRIRALDALLPDQTTQQGLRLQVSLQMAPLTSAVVGGRYRELDSNVARDGREGSVFLGLDHRF